MKHIDVKNFRKNLSGALDLVNQDREPMLITRPSGQNGVLMSEKDFNSYEEMWHLTASIANIEAINIGIAEIEAGQGVEMSLEDIRDI
jgi:antitoxin YefM